MALVAYAPQRLARTARKIMVNIDGGEIAKLGGIIDVPVAADVGEFIRGLLREAGDVRTKDRSGWFRRCHDWKVRYPFVHGRITSHGRTRSACMRFPGCCPRSWRKGT